jgi:molybdopterin-containing oxidoreductase family iron-sulfur binding subunit
VLNAQQPLKGGGLRILTESISSPTLAAQLREFLSRYPSARWHQWDPASRENARAGAKLAFGQYVDPQYRIDRADVIVSLDADFLGSGPGSLRYARDFAARRRPENASAMNRLYAIESMPTSTGARADHRLPSGPATLRPPRDSSRRARSADRGRHTFGGDVRHGTRAEIRRRRRQGFATHRGSSLVVAGDAQPRSCMRWLTR